jgi:hypothetical protein
MREWIGVLTRALEEAQKAGHISADIDMKRLTFEIQSIAIGGLWARQLLDDRDSYSRSRAAILDKLRGIATPQCPPLPSAAVAKGRRPKTSTIS